MTFAILFLFFVLCYAGFAILIGKAIHRGMDPDRPEHVNETDWQRVNRRRA